jgi:hypothetical protein
MNELSEPLRAIDGLFFIWLMLLTFVVVVGLGVAYLTDMDERLGQRKKRGNKRDK